MKLRALNEATLVWGPLSEEAVQRLKEQGSLVVVAENRPSLAGLKHDLPLLAKEGIGSVYCPDNALGLLFYQQKIKKALISRGPGSLYAALLSKVHNVPFEIVDQGSLNTEGLDRSAATLEGRNFILEVDREEYIIEPGEELTDTEAAE